MSDHIPTCYCDFGLVPNKTVVKGCPKGCSIDFREFMTEYCHCFSKDDEYGDTTSCPGEGHCECPCIGFFAISSTGRVSPLCNCSWKYWAREAFNECNGNPSTASEILLILQGALESPKDFPEVCHYTRCNWGQYFDPVTTDECKVYEDLMARF